MDPNDQELQTPEYATLLKQLNAVAAQLRLLQRKVSELELRQQP